MKKSLRYPLILVFLLQFLWVSAQKNGVFTGEASTFPNEVYQFMSTIEDQHDDKIDEFIKAWEKDSIFSAEEQSDIIRLSQLLIKKNAKSFPHFLNYLSCILAFKEFNTNPSNYRNWVDGFAKLLENKKTTVTTFNNVLEFTNKLLRENLLYTSNSTQWKASNRDYKIINDEDLRVDFKKLDLTCYAKRDSMQLFETSGTAYPAESKWIGDGGLVTWERGGYNRSDVFADLKEYEIDLTKSEYTAEEVIFTHKIYFDEPLKGTLNDKVKYNKEPEDATYPQFDSYTKEFTIPNLYKDINYEGGLSMQGSKLVGTGTIDKNAKLKIYRNDTLILVASSSFFGFRSDRISSLRTSVAIRLGIDSIFHPDLFFTYRVNIKELTLLKTDNYSSQGPYTNSYHKVDMNFDQLTWRTSESTMKFTAPRGSAIGNAYFESVNYFNYDKFIAMMMMDKAHPLVSIKNFAKKYGSDDFPAEALAEYLKMPFNQIEQLAMRMAYSGFVYYDVNTQTITIKPRLYDYLASSINKIDYDVISFASQVDAPLENAIFDLNTYDLTINGIPLIYVSDSQNVVIYPKNNKIILKNNRNFQFNGTVDAGLLTFYGNNFFFSYDSFKINLQNVDSLHIKYLNGKFDNFGNLLTEDVKNLLHSVTGEVLIDHIDNKSGRISYPDYPIFNSNESSYVYYEQTDIQKGVYESNDFFFEVYPFVMDSLDNFNYQDLLFKGKFVSAGIFPDFEKQLSLQADNSLGFRHKTPPEGYPVYGDKGTYFSEIWLSNQGLKGNGDLKYITSTTYSKDFNFYPDSMNTLSTRYTVDLQTTETQYPMVRSVNNKIHWLPYADVMYAYRTDTLFTLFNDSTTLRGDLKLQPIGLSGWGRMDLKNSEIQSDLFTYKAFDINSDTSDFFLKSLYTDGFTVLTENVNSHIDYTQGMGYFKSNAGFSLVTFPDNKYISYLDYFVWDMEKKKVALGSKTIPQPIDYTYEDVEPEGPRYISVKFDQDSLNFVSPLAYYDYKNNFIKATGVKFIEVADARIYPDSGNITIERDALMEALENARVRANKTSKYHTLHSATLNIISKNYYEGFANYDYIDENDKVELIHFSDVKVDSGKHTAASGDIYESADFTLSPAYKYQGKVFLFADDSLLTFRGSTQIEHNCETLLPDWIYFQSRIDPRDIYIPYSDKPVNINRTKIQSGIYLAYDSVHVYPSFLISGKNYSDNALVNSNGYLYYDKAQQLYKIGSKAKINDFSLPENYLSLSREDCKLSGEGNVNLGANLGQVKLTAYGSVKNDLDVNETNLDLVLSVDFYMSGPMIQLMAKEIDSVPDLPAVDLSRQLIRKQMDAAVGAETAQKLRDELTLFGDIKQLPQQLKHTIVFNELKLKWNDETNSYCSQGKIGIGTIDNIQINKRIKGFFELQIKRSGDILDFYLDMGRGNYYYFGYTRGVMQTLSNNSTYIETIMNMKPKDRKLTVPRNETSYIYLISTEMKKAKFYRRYKDAEEGKLTIEEEVVEEEK